MEKENYILFARSQPHGKIIVEVINSRVQAEKKRNTFISEYHDVIIINPRELRNIPSLKTIFNEYDSIH